jgi:queuine/archaeosine tRNA-ribosyltransferase
MLELMKHAQQAIIEDRYPDFVREFFGKIYANRADFPKWAVDSLKMVGLEL